MPNYLLAYTGGTRPEDTEAAKNAWLGWFGGLGAAVVEIGNPFSPDSASVASDGSANGSAPPGLTGFSIISADSLADASRLVSDGPQIANGGAVEIYETYPV